MPSAEHHNSGDSRRKVPKWVHQLITLGLIGAAIAGAVERGSNRSSAAPKQPAAQAFMERAMFDRVIDFAPQKDGSISGDASCGLEHNKAAGMAIAAPGRVAWRKGMPSEANFVSDSQPELWPLEGGSQHNIFHAIAFWEPSIDDYVGDETDLSVAVSGDSVTYHAFYVDGNEPPLPSGHVILDPGQAATGTAGEMDFGFSNNNGTIDVAVACNDSATLGAADAQLLRQAPALGKSLGPNFDLPYPFDS